MERPEELIRIATFNVHRLEHGSGIEKLLTDNGIDICGMQEVNGARPLRNAFSQEWECLFDYSYPNYGNGLVFRRNKFHVRYQATHELKGTPGKKTAFEVCLTVRGTNNVLILFVTHLDYKTEEQRMREFTQLQKILPKTDAHFLLGDFNSLSRGDYTDDQWQVIIDSRKQSSWEDPKTDIISTVLQMGYKDVLSEVNAVAPTCRFNTRVDYIFTFGIEHRRAFVTDSQGTSDHKVVVVDFPQ